MTQQKENNKANKKSKIKIKTKQTVRDLFHIPKTQQDDSLHEYVIFHRLSAYFSPQKRLPI